MFKNHKLQEQLHAMMQERASYLRAARHADGLMYACGILPSGRELVSWLGHAGMRSNREAVTFWVHHQLNEPGWDAASMEIGVLLKRLNRRLREIELDQT